MNYSGRGFTEVLPYYQLLCSLNEINPDRLAVLDPVQQFNSKVLREKKRLSAKNSE